MLLDINKLIALLALLHLQEALVLNDKSVFRLVLG